MGCLVFNRTHIQYLNIMIGVYTGQWLLKAAFNFADG